MNIAKGALLCCLLVSAGLTLPAAATSGQSESITVTEGTAMAASVSPDGQTIVMDLQGSLWTLPVSGGDATRITGEYQDARQPVWMPDNQTIVFFSFKDGGYDLWSVDRSGENMTALTWGPYDDREPAVSSDGKFVAFASDRKNSFNSYDIYKLELASGVITQLTDDKYENRMPVWKSTSDALTYTTMREGRHLLVTIDAKGNETIEQEAEHALTPMLWDRGELVYAAASGDNQTVMKRGSRVIASGEEVFEFKASLSASGEVTYVAGGKIKTCLLYTSPSPRD